VGEKKSDGSCVALLGQVPALQSSDTTNVPKQKGATLASIVSVDRLG
jgi:hypothetical protein